MKSQLLLIIAIFFLISIVGAADNYIVTFPMDGQLKVGQLDYGYNVSLLQYSLNSSVSIPAGQSWELLGSINGENYNLIDTQSNIALVAETEQIFTVLDSSSYRYFAFVMTGGFYQSGTLYVNFTSTKTTDGMPVTDFYTTTSTTVLGSTTKFIDSSTNTPYGWYWLFGDGATSSAQNPYHTYSNYGYYTVNHSSTNYNGLTTWNNKSDYVVIVPSSPIIITKFKGTPTSGVASLPVAFSDTSLALPYPVTSWLWDFGDGGSSTVQNPTYTYNTPGIYSVTLTTSNSNVTNSTTYTDYISLSAPIPNTAFIKSISNDGTITQININRYNYGTLSLFDPDTKVAISTPQTLTYMGDSTTMDTIATQPAIAFYRDDGSYWIYRTV